MNEPIPCNSEFEVVVELLQRLLVEGHPTVELTTSDAQRDAEAHTILRRIYAWMVEARLIDASTPICEDRSGHASFRIPNPRHGFLDLPARIRLSQVSPCAALLLAFQILRVRYQSHAGEVPMVRFIAQVEAPRELDGLYLLGDVFSERYGTMTHLRERRGRVELTLTGHVAPVSGGLGWARADYINSRDVSLLCAPLREVLQGPDRVLIIPRFTPLTLDQVRVRIPSTAPEITGARWLDRLAEIDEQSSAPLLGGTGQLGEHVTFEPGRRGYVVSIRGDGSGTPLPVISHASSGAGESTLDGDRDDRIAITLEGLGGAREIGANAYYYRFGHRGLLIDAVFQ